jgi:predicted anti-sigma-YlaC factor YlaD
MGLLHITCKKATFLISKKEEKKLSWLERWQLRGHLTICSLCRKFEEQSGWIGRMARQYAHSHDLTLPEASKEKMQEQLNQQP